MPTAPRLIIFFIPPAKIVNGGILSIFSICKESRALKAIHGADVVIATYPGTKSYRKNDLFKNNEVIYSFDELVKRGVPSFLQLHVPEYASYDTFQALKEYTEFLAAVADLRVNIMTQNILLMQPPYEVANWFTLTPYVTQTTAHNKYSTQELADRYHLPTYHLSTFVDPAQYSYVPFTKKKNVIALSPDITDKRELIVKELEKRLPNYEVITIQNMRYEDYKQFVSTAKFVITFGEGFDGYYVEAFFCGGMTLAVYNEEFFPDKSFAGLDNLFTDYEAMLKGVVARITKLEDKERYEKVSAENLTKIKKLYSFPVYQNNVKKFYLGEASYVPKSTNDLAYIADIVSGYNKVIDNLNGVISQRDHEIAERNKEVAELGEMVGQRDKEIITRNEALQAMEQSRSWKVTKPLRKAAAIVKRT